MKNKFVQIVFVTIFGLLLAGGSQSYVLGQDAKDDGAMEPAKSGRHNIVGTWQTVVTPRNCQNGDPVAPPFPGILTFNKGGTLSGTSATVAAAFGIWDRHHGADEFALAFVSLRFSPTGVFLGTQRVRQTATLNAAGNGFTSTGTVQVLDPNGVVVGSGCASSVGTRFE